MICSNASRIPTSSSQDHCQSRPLTSPEGEALRQIDSQNTLWPGRFSTPEDSRAFPSPVRPTANGSFLAYDECVMAGERCGVVLSWLWMKASDRAASLMVLWPAVTIVSSLVIRSLFPILLVKSHQGLCLIHEGSVPCYSCPCVVLCSSNFPCV